MTGWLGVCPAVAHAAERVTARLLRVRAADR
jgi:hypothetical protein